MVRGLLCRLYTWEEAGGALEAEVVGAGPCHPVTLGLGGPPAPSCAPLHWGLQSLPVIQEREEEACVILPSIGMMKNVACRHALCSMGRCGYNIDLGTAFKLILYLLPTGNQTQRCLP